MHRFAGECNNDNNEPTLAVLCGLFLLRRSYMLRNTSHCHTDLIANQLIRADFFNTQLKLKL
jgi:hypothetical protein